MILDRKCPICSSKLQKGEVICYNCENEIYINSRDNKCPKCGRKMLVSKSTICDFCKRVKPKFDVACSVFPYKDNFKTAIQGAKFYNEYYRIKNLSRLMTVEFLKMNFKADYIVYVPSDIETQYNRRYSLAQQLACEIGKETRIKVCKDFLMKKSGHKKQSLVQFNERYTNIIGAYIKNPFAFKNIKDKNILLVDDVITTGATLSECAKILEKHGAKSVYAITLSYSTSNS